MTRYYAPQGGLPPQTERIKDKALFTEAYALIPKGVLSDITTSFLPGWDKTRLWVIARPLTGFAETFSHYIMEVAAGGGASQPDNNKEAQSVLFVVEGSALLAFEGQTYRLTAGSYAYLPAGLAWSLQNDTDEKIVFHWIRKRYEEALAFQSHQPLSPMMMMCRRLLCLTPRVNGRHRALLTQLIWPMICMSTSSPFSQVALSLRRNACDGTWALCASGHRVL